MRGCPFCDDLKKMLVEEGIDFHDRDINDKSMIYSQK